MNLVKTTVPDLFRDEETGAIVCTDVNSYQNYLATRKNTQRVAELEEQLNKLLTSLNTNK